MLRRWISEQRRGFALATAVGALALVGALVAGAFVASTSEFRTGRDAIQQTRAFAAAEFGNSAMRANWNNAWNNSMLRGDTLIRTYNVNGAVATVRVTRLSDADFSRRVGGVRRSRSVDLTASRRQSAQAQHT